MGTGLILYAHHTSEKWDNQPADEILNIFDAYNDPSLICQWGFMAEVFLKGLVAPASATAEIVYTQEDLLTLPSGHMMPNCFLPYVMNTASVFLDGGAAYTGAADVAVNAGFVNTGDLSQAKHGVAYAWSPWRDAFRRFRDESRLPAAKDGEELQPGVTLGKDLVFENICALSGAGDYRAFAQAMTQAMHQWGVLPEGTGFVDGKLISQTGELVFDPDHAQFAIQSESAPISAASPAVISPWARGLPPRQRTSGCPSPPCPWTASPFRRRKRCSSPLWERPAWMKPPRALWSSSPACLSPPAPSRANCTPTLGRAPSPLRETPPLSLWTCMATSLGRSPGRQQLTGRGSTSLRTCLLPPIF